MYIATFNEYLRKRFGHKLYKLALDGGMTCPNRDGTLGTRGCIFCLDGSGSFAERRCGSITEQLTAAKARLHGKDGAECGYIAYFQSYTNTYATAERLRVLFTEAIEAPGVEVLSIATRPDCLPDETVALLAELNAIKPVWVELGLQTVSDETARLIRRGYELPVFDDAVQRLNRAGIETIAHVIFGLPGETREDMLRTVRHVAGLPIQGVKLQLLHILHGTDLYDMYMSGEVRPLEPDEYFNLLSDAIELLPRDMVIHRLTGDGDKRSLAAPLWSADKKRVRADMERFFAARDTEQGRAYTPVSVS